MALLLRCLLALALLAGGARAETVQLAVAANFRKPVEALAADFAARTGNEVVISTGSTGQLYAQIANGAPFDVFLAADEARPEKAVAAGLAVEGTRFTYARGRLILIFHDADVAARVGSPPELGEVRTLSIANPATAPYGAAAMQVLRHLGVADALAGRIAEAQNVAGVNAAVASGAAEAGFAALGSVQAPGGPAPEGWLVPAGLYAPIRQDAVLLEHGAGNGAARAFLGYLKGEGAQAIIRGHGYDVD